MLTIRIIVAMIIFVLGYNPRHLHSHAAAARALENLPQTEFAAAPRETYTSIRAFLCVHAGLWFLPQVIKSSLARTMVNTALEAQCMIIQEIRDRLEKHSNPEKRRKRVHWEKQYQEAPKSYGVSTPIVRKLSSEFFQKIKKKQKQEILQLCGYLLESGYSEERTIAFDWTFRLRKIYEKTDFQLLETWLMKHVHGWGACDDLCTHALGAFIYQFPAFIERTRGWTRSRSRWVRRASAVSLIYSVRRKRHLGAVLETADALLTDQDVMVQKGYGWMLKEASNNYPKEVFAYVMKNKQEMPRTALRYAIEKLSSELRGKAMKRE